MRNLIWLLGLGLVACTNSKVDKGLLIGTWRNTALTVKINAFENQDSTKWLVARKGQWEEVLQIKPIETTYFPDGSFESVYFGLDNKILGTEKGSWILKGDSLVLSSPQYSNSYKLEVDKNEVRFVAWLDWDQEGQKDDLYDGWQVKIKP